MKTAVVNHSKCNPADFHKAVQAVDLQVLNDIGPEHGVYGVVDAFEDESLIPADTHAIVYVQDSIDDPQAYGYHDEVSGKIVAYIAFGLMESALGDPMRNPLNQVCFSGVLSHEIGELVKNPFVNRWLSTPDPKRFIAYELSDPDQGGGYWITVLGTPVLVSNFVFEAWTDAEAAPGTRLDYLGRISTPLSHTAEGYLAVDTDGVFSTEMGERVSDYAKAKVLRSSGRIGALQKTPFRAHQRQE